MATTAWARKGKRVHLTDELQDCDFAGMTADRPLKTRCGRTLQNAVLGVAGGAGLARCPRCGADADFEAAREDLNARCATAEARRLEEQRQRSLAVQRAMLQRRAFLHEAAGILAQQLNCEIRVEDHYGGATVTLRHAGFTYELHHLYR